MFGAYPGLGGLGIQMLGKKGFQMQNLKSLGVLPGTLADLASGAKHDSIGSLALAAGLKKPKKKGGFSDKDGAAYLAGLDPAERDKLLAHESVDPLEHLIEKRRQQWEGSVLPSVSQAAQGIGGLGGTFGNAAVGLKSMTFDATPLDHEVALAEYIRSMQTKRLSTTAGTLSRTTAMDRQLEERADRRRQYIR